MLQATQRGRTDRRQRSRPVRSKTETQRPLGGYCARAWWRRRAVSPSSRRSNRPASDARAGGGGGAGRSSRPVKQLCTPAGSDAERLLERRCAAFLRKSSIEFDFDHTDGLKRDLFGHLCTIAFVSARDYVVSLGPRRIGRTPLRLVSRPFSQARDRVLFATANQWVDGLAILNPLPDNLSNFSHRLHRLRKRARGMRHCLDGDERSLSPVEGITVKAPATTHLVHRSRLSITPSKSIVGRSNTVP